MDQSFNESNTLVCRSTAAILLHTNTAVRSNEEDAPQSNNTSVHHFTKWFADGTLLRLTILAQLLGWWSAMGMTHGRRRSWRTRVTGADSAKVWLCGLHTVEWFAWNRPGRPLPTPYYVQLPSRSDFPCNSWSSGCSSPAFSLLLFPSDTEYGH